MRYEARHHYFKRMAQNIGNYINLSYTLAMRHQYLQCYYHQSQALFESDVEIGPGKTVSVIMCFPIRWCVSDLSFVAIHR